VDHQGKKKQAARLSPSPRATRTPPDPAIVKAVAALDALRAISTANCAVSDPAASLPSTSCSSLPTAPTRLRSSSSCSIFLHLDGEDLRPRPLIERPGQPELGGRLNRGGTDGLHDSPLEGDGFELAVPGGV
jgi:hypothetical protein